uniref:Armadillo repeat-containing protein 8 n=1 Tax=Kalanchoe fedtschenkoi TaxID=63787 RepID=A0A7N0ZZA4_KALFE
MPTPSSAATATHRLPEDVLPLLSSLDASERLQALREVKNQIIGNRTKKLSFLKLGAVPPVVSALASAVEDGSDSYLILQSAAAVGSFACGFDAGVKAVLDAGAFPLLEGLLSHPDDKVVDAGARSLKMIYQSKFAPKYEFVPGKPMDFLHSLLNNENENLNALGLSIIVHSCKTNADQKTICGAGILEKVINHLDGSINLRDSCLESLATLVKANTDAIAQLVTPVSGSGFPLRSIEELIKDKSPRTRLLACSFLTVLRNSGPTHLLDETLKTLLLDTLLHLVDDAGHVGDDALFVLSEYIANKEDMQSLEGYYRHAVIKLWDNFPDDPLSDRRLSGTLLALAELFSVLESCRSELFLYTKALDRITNALTHYNPEVRVAACICLRNLSRSVQYVSAGRLMTEKIIKSLVALLQDSSHSIQVASLATISNIVVDFAMRKSLFMNFGGLKELIELSKSMESNVRVNAVRALRNLMFHADKKCREKIFSDLTKTLIECLIQDAEPTVQEQALAMVRNLVDGSVSNIDFVFEEDCIILNAVCKQLHNAEVVEVQIQGMYVLSNIASGNELHKDVILHHVAPEAAGGSDSITIKFLQSADSRLRTATIWTIVNLTRPSTPGPGAHRRVERLRSCGIISQIKTMVNDPCLDVKLRAMKVIEQSSTEGDGSATL